MTSSLVLFQTFPSLAEINVQDVIYALESELDFILN